MPRAKTSEIPYNEPWPASLDSAQTKILRQEDETQALIERAQTALARRTRLRVSPWAMALALLVVLSLLSFLGFSAYLSHWKRPHVLAHHFPQFLGEGEGAEGWVYFQDRDGDVIHLLFEPIQGRFFGFTWAGPFWLTSSTGFVEFRVGVWQAEQGQAAFRLVLVDKGGHATSRVIRLFVP